MKTKTLERIDTFFVVNDFSNESRWTIRFQNRGAKTIIDDFNGILK